MKGRRREIKFHFDCHDQIIFFINEEEEKILFVK
jgi:hypothetical protein